MANALMFVAYENGDRSNVTVSPRTTSGHNPPEHTKDVNVTLLPGSGVVNNVFNVNAMCTGCRTWDSGSIDSKSTSQNMIWAIGPAWSLASDDLNAPIRQHQIQSTFALSMVAATGAAGVPGTSASVDSGDTGDDDNGFGPPVRPPGKVLAHSLLMIGSFLILFPGGYLVLRVFEKVLAHAAVQAVAMLLVIISTGLGVSISKGMKIVSLPRISASNTDQNQSPNLTNPHQIIGFLVLVLVLASFGIGAAGHAVYRKTSEPAKFMIGHRILGPLTITLGLVNVCVGFNFAGNRRPIIPFVVISLLMIIFVSGVIFFVRRRRVRRGAMNTPAAQNFREGQAHGVPAETGQGPAIPMQSYQPKQAEYR